MADAEIREPRRSAVVEADLAGLAGALEREVLRVRGLVRSAPSLAVPVPGLDWDVGGVLAHLTAVHGAFASAVGGADLAALGAGAGLPEVPRLSGSVKDVVTVVNELVVGALSFADPNEAADALDRTAAALRKALALAPDPHTRVPTPWYGDGATRTVATLAGLALSETLVHGVDLARALGAREVVPQDAAAAAAPLLMTGMLPTLLDARTARGFTGHFGIVLRGAGRFVISVQDGLSWSSRWDEQRRDCVISMRPGTALLLGLRRIPQWRAVATGGVCAYGRKPWLGLRFLPLFATP